MKNWFLEYDEVTIAYKKLKRIVYYDKTQLHLRKRLSEFETGERFEESLKQVSEIVSGDRPLESNVFRDWLNQIGFKVVPKGVKEPASEPEAKGQFISNVTTKSRYEVEKVNYFFDGPIELYLISVLWIMKSGYKLDRKLNEHSMGSRLREFVGTLEDNSAELFRQYHAQYAKWRDDGIKKAESLLLDEKQDVWIVALDLQEFYYRVPINWKNINLATTERPPTPTVNPRPKEEGTDVLEDTLLECVRAMSRVFTKKTFKFFQETHPDLYSRGPADFLPIGLPSSPVIANWCLHQFDQDVLSKVRPSYYARYVDDIIIVLPAREPLGTDPISDFMKKTLLEAGIVKWRPKAKGYELLGNPGLFLQKKKCVLQYFETGHSIAGLEKFRKQIEENASDFGMLPVDEEPTPLEQVAYDLLYNGSVNKFRSVQKLGDNRLELAKHLAKQTTKHLLTRDQFSEDTRRELFHFFKGRNAITYWDMWERVLAFIVVAGDSDCLLEFMNAIREEIGKITFGDVESSLSQELLHDFLHEHLKLCWELGEAIRAYAEETANAQTWAWRRSNLIRHQLVGIPLLNFTDFSGDLRRTAISSQQTVNPEKVMWSPRHVHFDECVEFAERVDFFSVDDLNAEDEISTFTHAINLYRQFHGTEPLDVEEELWIDHNGGTREK